MEHLSMEVEQNQPQAKKEHIEWRRAQVLELSSQGRTEREIAIILKVGLGTVARDISFLNKQARKNLQVHIQQRLPEQYQKCCNGLTQVLKMAWNIVILDSVNQSTKLQALSLISDCYKYQMDLTTGSAIITDAVKMVTRKTEQLDTLKKLDEKIESFDEDEQGTTTTNGVF